MSFVITTVSPETIVQVSDTRLSSLADQSILSDALRKSIIVEGREARFVLGWIGLATAARGHSTADWLFRVLYEMNAVELPPDQVLGNLASLATAHFRTVVAPDKRLQVVLGGWHKSEPFVGVVSNCVSLIPFEQSDSNLKHCIPAFSDVATPPIEFRSWIQGFKNPKEWNFLFNANGDCDSRRLNAHFKGLKELLKRRVGAQRIGAACRQIAWEAGRHSRTIGKDLITIEMDRTGQGYCSHHSEKGAEQMLIPDLLTLRGSSTRTTVGFSLSKGEMNVRIRAKIAK